MKHAVCWIRRDLRLHDHTALSMALKKAEEVTLVFIFDNNILEKLPNPNDQRLSFIIDSLKEMEEHLQKKSSSIHILHGDPSTLIPKFVKNQKAEALFFNKDYEPYAKERDQKVIETLIKQQIDVFAYRDHVIFEANEVRNGQGEMFKVFTPYKNKWLQTSYQKRLEPFPVKLGNLKKFENPKSILNHDWYKELKFIETPPYLKAGTKASKKVFTNFEEIISKYHERRDTPSIAGTSSLSVYIRHGNLSIRDMFRLALSGKTEGHRIWLSELIWREFYQALLDEFPQIEKTAFKTQYDNIKWSGGKKEFEAWANGTTGYPIIDASMRCLNLTGTLHNRLRMVVASFLCKTLLVDWRKGEKYFAEKLLDFDLAANNGGWQWSSSSGADSQPYFRIFNPMNQSQKFDSEGIFIKQYCPELSHLSKKEIHNPINPIVDYKSSRDKALKMYKEAVSREDSL